MHIGEPLRTIVVEPLELPVSDPTAEPDPLPVEPEIERVPEPATVNIPNYVSPIIAYRAWNWDVSGLTSLSRECWRPGRPHTAQCGMALDRHQAPQMGCTCGIYATKDPESVSCFGIYGEVYLWGTVVEHELGWRAQFAYPKRLVLSFWGRLSRLPVQGTTLIFRTERWLAPLTAYGADIFLASEKGYLSLWTARSGYDTDGLKRLREAATVSRRWPRSGLLRPTIRDLVKKLAAHRKRPPGPPPPPPAVPVDSPADIIRIIQSRRHGWPAHWTLASDCETREACHGRAR